MGNSLKGIKMPKSNNEQEEIDVKGHNVKSSSSAPHIRPPSELQWSGNLGENLKFFRQKFKIYLVASKSQNEDSEYQVSLLLSIIGDRALKVFNNFTYTGTESAKDLKHVLKKFDNYFLPEVNVTFERHNFFLREQKDNYSIWYGEYKYPEELKKVYMSCNLITGMFQRLDKMRKQAFTSVCLFGKDDDSTISGIWVWRGQGLAFELSPDWQIDLESYDWKKLDATSADTKQLVQQYFSWTGKDKAGREFNQGKIFK